VARKSKGPWFWKKRGEFVVNVRGKRHYLGEDREAAFDEWHRLCREKPQPVSTNTVWAILEAFLDHAAKNTVPATYEWYRYRLQQFKDALPDQPVHAVKVYQVTDWLDKQDWGATYKAGMVTAIKRAFKWADDGGRIERNPLKALKKPSPDQREVTITAEDFANILLKVRKDGFRDILTFIWLTGCRPQEARAIEAKWINHESRVIVFPVKKSKGKKRARVIHLTDEAYTILARWAEKYPDGPCFRNRKKEPWRANNFCCRFYRLQAKVGFKLRMYDLRHSYAHSGLTKGGIAPEVMAALLGHTDTRMIYSTYGHLLKATDFMRAAAEKTRPSVDAAKSAS
jgi:integrase